MTVARGDARGTEENHSRKRESQVPRVRRSAGWAHGSWGCADAEPGWRLGLTESNYFLKREPLSDLKRRVQQQRGPCVWGWSGLNSDGQRHPRLHTLPRAQEQPCKRGPAQEGVGACHRESPVHQPRRRLPGWGEGALALSAASDPRPKHGGHQGEGVGSGRSGLWGGRGTLMPDRNLGPQRGRLPRTLRVCTPPPPHPVPVSVLGTWTAHAQTNVLAPTE